MTYIVRIPPPFLFLLPFPEGESEKLKTGWKYGAGVGLLKKGGAGTFPV